MTESRTMSEILEVYAEWVGFEPTREELLALIPEEAQREIRDRFYRNLAFGTGGLRGLMGAGTNRMNEPMVAMATQGLANYVRSELKGSKRSAVVCHDARHNSRRFAEVTAEVLAGNGFKVHLFKEMRLTPEISFAVRELEATVGVMITASHNPPEYNGYKAYWSDGGQLIPPHDVGVIDEVEKIDTLEKVKRMPLKEAAEKKKIEWLGAEMDEAYLAALDRASYDPDGNKEKGDSVSVVYTPLHGVGGTLARKALERWGFRNVHEVPSQIEPDPDFPTVKSANPEDPAAFEEAVKLAREVQADIVVASDPDADRMGLVARNRRGKYRFITGNQMAALFTYYVCEGVSNADERPELPLIVTTVVTTDLVRLIAESYDVGVVETLTGFKWIGNQATVQDEARGADRPARTFLFGCEESYGYLFGDHARDKDGIVSLCMAAEIARRAKEHKLTVPDMIDRIYQRFGVFDESQVSVYMRGETGMSRIQEIMDHLRDTPPDKLGGEKVARITDFLKVSFRDAKGHLLKGAKQLPESNVLMFELAHGGKVVARPSGTEPKIKFYFNLCDRSSTPLNKGELARRRKALSDFAKRVKKDFLKHAGANSKK